MGGKLGFQLCAIWKPTSRGVAVHRGQDLDSHLSAIWAPTWAGSGRPSGQNLVVQVGVCWLSTWAEIGRPPMRERTSTRFRLWTPIFSQIWAATYPRIGQPRNAGGCPRRLVVVQPRTWAARILGRAQAVFVRSHLYVSLT